MLTRILLALLLLVPSVGALAQPFPSPTYNNITVGGNESVSGNLGVFGKSSLIGGGQFEGTFTGPSIIRGMIAGLNNVTTGGLSSLSPSAGDTVFVTDCVNGSQSFPGSGCPAVWNGSSWQLHPSPSPLTITVAGQAVRLGGTVSGQGNGGNVLTATGTFTNGDCIQANAGGAAVDAGVPCGGGGGGSGTVVANPQFSMTYYSGAGTSSVVSGLGIVNNAVLVTNGSGVPSESATLPTGLTIPSATLNNAVLTGTPSIATATYTGKQTFQASTVSLAGVNFQPGVAPTTPVNGDHWETTIGVFDRINGATQGPYLYNIATTAPLAGGGLGPTLTLTCPTCATTTNGGALTATTPMAISPAGVISLGSTLAPLTWIADSTFTVHNDSYPLIMSWPWTNSGTINKVVYHTGGTTSPAFTATFEICTGELGGTCTAITGCSNLSVSSASDTTASCSAANTINSGQTLGMVISGVTGAPSSAALQLTLSKPAS